MRKQLRTWKRIAKDRSRKQKQKEYFSRVYTYDSAFTYTNIVNSVPKSLRGVYWKASVQNYHFYSLLKTLKDYESLVDRRLPKSVTCRTIQIYERGKRREITPIHIRDRVIQKTLCDNCLTPILSSKLIYDNGASLPEKGVAFTRDRLNHHLQQAIKEYGTDFYVLRFDFKSYFDSISHSISREILNEYIADKELVDITMDIIKQPYMNKAKRAKDKEEMKRLANDECIGICLGSQVSQIMALIVPNVLDHYIKEKARVKHYVRYMDDGIIFAKTKEELNNLLAEMTAICDRLNLHFNTKKTTITKIHRGFTFLKIRYNITDSGKIIRRLSHDSIVRMRRKLKKFRRKVDDGLMTMEQVNASMQSWLSHSKTTNSCKTVLEMKKLYDDLFRKEMKTDELLQTDRWANYRWGCNQQRFSEI